MITHKFIAEIEAAATKDPEKIAFLGRFFKTGPGQYGEGDVFIGVTVPQLRSICRKYIDMPLKDIETLLESKVHEIRLAAVIIMALQAKSKKTPAGYKKSLYELYLRRTDRINNWDIVDSSCRDVVGEYLIDKPRYILYTLAKSDNVWERRIAIVSTWAFIRQGDFTDTLKVSELLLKDTHDLIHKAVGWMLREMGKRSETDLRKFLDTYAQAMPRTALRYAIERLDQTSKKRYMQQKSQHLVKSE